MIFLSGIFFPREGVGAAFSAFTWLLPLTHAVEGARALNEGRFFWTAPGAMAWLAAAAVILIPAAIRMIHRRIVK